MNDCDEIEFEELDSCPHCGNSMFYEDCPRCYGVGGYDDADDTGGSGGSDWEDCCECEGTGVRTFCPNAACPGKDKPVSDSGTSAGNRIATSVATRNVTETTPQEPPILREWFPIVDRQPDPGARARRKARKRERQNRRRGRQQHAH